MEKICKNSKNYKLTENQLYTIIKSEKGYVFVENDNNKIARYDESLFEDPLPTRTEQHCINSISVEQATEEEDTVITFINLNNEVVEIVSALGGFQENSFSCGILQVVGINNMMHRIEEIVDTSENDLILLKRKLLNSAITSLLSNYTTSKGMWMCSTNQNTNFEDYFTELDEMSNHNSGWFRNPNSGNQINMWYGIINQN